MIIYKYRIILDDITELSLPEGAEVLCFKQQEVHMFIWVLVDEQKIFEKKMELRKFRLFGTGHIIDDEVIDKLVYIGTVVSDPMVWHLFEEAK